MDKFVAILQLLAAAILALFAILTLVNLVFITTRPETISVVNAIIGQGVLIICLSALANILFRKGLKQLRAGDAGADSGQEQD
ncbi:MAG: hypothetical protein RL839_01910 [Gammaproteobacteria bacterium]